MLKCCSGRLYYSSQGPGVFLDIFNSHRMLELPCVGGTLLNPFNVLTLLPHQPCEAGVIISPILYMKKLRHKKVKHLSVVTHVVCGRAGTWFPVPDSVHLIDETGHCHKILLAWPDAVAEELSLRGGRGTGLHLQQRGRDLAVWLKGSSV